MFHSISHNYSKSSGLDVLRGARGHSNWGHAAFAEVLELKTTSGDPRLDRGSLPAEQAKGHQKASLLMDDLAQPPGRGFSLAW
jgi:hypothetical protein